jgi:hypothetical protein
MKATVSWCGADGKPIAQQDIDVELSDTIILCPVFPAVTLSNGITSVETDLRNVVKGIHIKITEVDGDKTRGVLSIIKAYVEEIYWREQKKCEATPWYHPLMRSEAFHNYQFVHVIREIIKKVDNK